MCSSCHVFHREMMEKKRETERKTVGGKKKSPQLVIPHYVKLNFPSRSSFIWRHYGGRVCAAAEKKIGLLCLDSCQL